MTQKCVLDIETADWPRPCYTRGPKGLWPPIATISWTLLEWNSIKNQFLVGPKLLFVVRPTDWTINADITSKSFLTDAYAQEVGVDLADILRLLKKDLDKSLLLIVYESKKIDILKHAFKELADVTDDVVWPKTKSIQDIFTLANKQWLVPGILKKPSLKASWHFLFDDLNDLASKAPEDPITSSASVSLLCEMICVSPIFSTVLTSNLNSLVK